jgi:hypothetical protein
MATATKPLNPVQGGRKVITKIRKLLPDDARWWIEYFDEDGIYLLDIYGDALNSTAIYSKVGSFLYELSQRGLSMAIITNDKNELQRHPELETFPV